MTRTTTTDLAEWLGRHGLGQYAKTFAENNIDYSVLPDLTENDLEKLGVSSLGHRKKLLRAIEALPATCQPTGTAKAVSSATAVPPSLVQHREAEFRQITVMFGKQYDYCPSGFDGNDLEKLGVSSLGHRKKLLRAIEALTAARQPTGTTKAVSSATVGATLSGATSRS